MPPKDKKLNYKQRQSLTFIQQSDPPFVKKIKEKLGYRESKVEDKFDHGDDPSTSRDDEDDIRFVPEDRRPQVVVVNPETDISYEQLDKEIKKAEEEEDRKKIEDGKIFFRKPEKRVAKENTKDDDQTDEKKAKKDHTASNKRLLSFGDDEE